MGSGEYGVLWETLKAALVDIFKYSDYQKAYTLRNHLNIYQYNIMYMTSTYKFPRIYINAVEYNCNKTSYNEFKVINNTFFYNLSSFLYKIYGFEFFC